MDKYEIAAEIRSSETWDMDMCAALCEAAGMADEWEKADAETFERVVERAAEKLDVEIY